MPKRFRLGPVVSRPTTSGGWAIARTLCWPLVMAVLALELVFLVRLFGSTPRNSPGQEDPSGPSVSLRSTVRPPSTVCPAGAREPAANGTTLETLFNALASDPAFASMSPRVLSRGGPRSATPWVVVLDDFMSAAEAGAMVARGNASVRADASGQMRVWRSVFAPRPSRPSFSSISGIAHRCSEHFPSHLGEVTPSRHPPSLLHHCTVPMEQAHLVEQDAKFIGSTLVGKNYKLNREFRRSSSFKCSGYKRAPWLKPCAQEPWIASLLSRVTAVTGPDREGLERQGGT